MFFVLLLKQKITGMKMSITEVMKSKPIIMASSTVHWLHDGSERIDFLDNNTSSMNDGHSRQKKNDENPPKNRHVLIFTL